MEQPDVTKLLSGLIGLQGDMDSKPDVRFKHKSKEFNITEAPLEKSYMASQILDTSNIDHNF